MFKIATVMFVAAAAQDDDEFTAAQCKDKGSPIKSMPCMCDSPAFVTCVNTGTAAAAANPNMADAAAMGQLLGAVGGAMEAEGAKMDADLTEAAADVGAAVGGGLAQVAALQANLVAAYGNCVNTFTPTDTCKPTATQKATITADVTAFVNAEANKANEEIEDAAEEAAAMLECVAKCKPDDADCQLGCASNAPVAGMSILAGALAAAAYMV